ncbi:FISUMP domain-containing protein [Riemerella anatipestifer]|nr:FISUMP domain-containing protein [Riemerella anatipestifer]
MKLNRFYLYGLMLVFFPLVVKAQVALRVLDPHTPDITLGNGKKRIASIYDADYFPYNITPRSEALWQRDIAADGIPEPLVIDHQGKITTTGFRVGISVTIQGYTTLPEYSTDITIPAAYTEDGNSRVLRFSWGPQICTPATTHIFATIRSLDGDLLIKKLDMNMGFGADVEGLLIGTFNYPDRYIGAGQVITTNAQYKLYAVTGIPDRCLGKTTSACVGYGANVREHDFIYTPLVGPDGKVWLGNNLGAEYAKYGSTWFDPAAQAGALNALTGQPLEYSTADQIKIDWRAYGSLFQWQRKPDGHELMNWTGSISGSLKYGVNSVITPNSWTNPNTNQYIGYWLIQTGPYNLWQSGQSNNPCPSGYHVPTAEELKTLHSAITGMPYGEPSFAGAIRKERDLKLPETGLWFDDLFFRSREGWYWGSSWITYNPPKPYRPITGGSVLNWTYNTSNVTAEITAYGFSVRCLKD